MREMEYFPQESQPEDIKFIDNLLRVRWILHRNRKYFPQDCWYDEPVRGSFEDQVEGLNRLAVAVLDYKNPNPRRFNNTKW